MVNRILRLWGVGLAIAIVVIGWPSPAIASIHTYHEQPGQVTFRSQQSLRDRQDHS